MKISRSRTAACFTGILLCLAPMAGCGNRQDFAVTQSQVAQSPAPAPAPGPDAPVAKDDTVVALGNGTLTQSAANGVLKNDQVNQATVEPFQGTTSAGAAVAIAADGSFTYTPSFGYIGTDSFSYTITNATGSSSATVHVVVSKRGFFVDTTAATNGTGAQSSPFNNLADALKAATFGDTVFIFAPSTISGQIDLPRGVNLIGQGSGLILAQTVVAPGSAPTLTGPLVCHSESVVSGFRIAGSASQGLMATDGFNLTIRANTFESPTSEQIRLDNPTGPITVEGNTFTKNAAGQDVFHAVQTQNQGFVLNINDNKFLSDGSVALGSAIKVEIPNTGSHQINGAGNVISGTDRTASFANGIEIDTNGSAVVGANLAGNTITRVQSEGIVLTPSGGSSFNASVSANQISESGDQNLLLDPMASSSGTVSVFANTLTKAGNDGMEIRIDQGVNFRVAASGNTVSGNTDDGIYVTGLAVGKGTSILEGNTLSDNGDKGIYGDLHQSSTSLLGIRNNRFSNSGGADAQFDGYEGGTACFDITGNTFTSNLGFSQADGASMTVERFSAGLENFNTFNGGSVVTTGTITPANAGDCNIK